MMTTRRHNTGTSRASTAARNAPSKVRFFLWSALSAVLGLVLAAFVWVRILHHGPPRGLLKDIRAGIAARHIQDPDKRLLKYLDARYGPMSAAANRQRAFLDFFSVDHIKGLQLLVRYSPPAQRQANIDAMARWVAGYRVSLTPDERAALNARLQSAQGRAMLRRATAQYNAEDVQYRGATAPVISQLLRTIYEVEHGR
jgi:hypothetical protein